MIKKPSENINFEEDDLKIFVHNNVELKHEKKEETIVNEPEHGPDKTKPYPVRNFFKELKRVIWPTSKKNYKYFFWIFVFIISLVVFFALISWGAAELIKLIGAN